jgi:esterase/lipase superfamily enzyme
MGQFPGGAMPKLSPKFWMITNRKVKEGQSELTADRGGLSFWVSDKGDLHKLQNWTMSDANRFKSLLLSEAGKFPLFNEAENEEQKHVTLFVHGYDNSWSDAARRYEALCSEMFSEADGMGVCVLFGWPSDGCVANYLPDRKDARESALDFADVLTGLFDLLATRQVAAQQPNPKTGLADSTKQCRAKTSIIAHSMGNYMLQKAMQLCWTRRNQPLLMGLINQLLMIGADVDNDLFCGGESINKGDGDAIANLTYRVSALYTGRDPVLGLSAGLKHFGKRRLGRSGLDKKFEVPDNVWDVDCTQLFPSYLSGVNVHSIYFKEKKILALMREMLRGVDRRILQARGLAPAAATTRVA